jgi:transglutaminase-like putative cysteine protease
MNIPARYCTGYLGDIGVPKDPAPMDFSAWFEVFLGGSWYTFDARHNMPRIGRIVIARGRDAADVAISTSFGPAKLARFQVVTDEIATPSLMKRLVSRQRLEPKRPGLRGDERYRRAVNSGRAGA